VTLIRFMWSHPAHWIALGFGSGLSPKAPGTVGTLWGWLSFVALQPWMNDTRWAILLGLGFLIGWWACTVAARNLNVADPSPVVWDEIIGIWLVLWLISPTSWLGQLVAFGLFRAFDAIKRGPVGWADSLFKLKPEPHAPGGMARPGWAQGFGILFDDLVAAGCTLLVIALWVFASRAWA
jgi:phosphatidylglycerophosphatase A